MADEKLNSLDDYESFVSETVRPWSQQQRVAVAVSMAERWLPAYESFSEENEWGDPATLQSIVESVWNCVLGHKLSSKDHRRCSDQLDENTPHLDDFDCEEAIATCAMIAYALDCCVKAGDPEDVVMAMVSGFEAVAPGIYSSPEDLPPDVWQSREVQEELAKQLKLLQLVGDMVRIDEQEIYGLRKKLVSSDLVGSVASRVEAVRRGLTNDEIFEQYRRVIEADLKSKWQWENNLAALGNFGAIVNMAVGEWLSRYSRRKQALEQGPMTDVAAYNALLARSSAHDAAVQENPKWDEETRFWIDIIYQNPHNGIDVKSPEQPHHYGPSLRRLWGERATEKDPWRSLLTWGRHRPPASNEKMKAELSERLSRPLTWHRTNDVDHPWATEVEGQTWRVRLNDFPDEVMYSLIIDGEVIGDFNDWPSCWTRD